MEEHQGEEIIKKNNNNNNKNQQICQRPFLWVVGVQHKNFTKLLTLRSQVIQKNP